MARTPIVVEQTAASKKAVRSLKGANRRYRKAEAEARTESSIVDKLLAELHDEHGYPYSQLGEILEGMARQDVEKRVKRHRER